MTKPTKEREVRDWEKEFEIVFAKLHDPDNAVKPYIKEFCRSVEDAAIERTRLYWESYAKGMADAAYERGKKESFTAEKIEIADKAEEQGYQKGLKDALEICKPMKQNEPKCYCKTHPEHECGITSNAAIDDVIASISKLGEV